MNITFETILERDMDFLLMMKFSQKETTYKNLFLEKVGLRWSDEWSVINVAHSVMTSDGETDVEVVLSDGDKKIGILIEDKIDAIAQPEQQNRYEKRAKKARSKGQYDDYYIFIVAPGKYLEGNQEASKYPNRVSYEEIRNILIDDFELAIIDKALYESKHGYVPIEDRNVTEFWNSLYDYVDEHFPDTFNIHGKKGESRGSNARWISISSGHGTTIQIKADRGYVDLEIARYAEKFLEFSKANQDLLDRKRLYLRVASKSLAIRKYIETIDFTKNFADQIDKVEDAFIKAKELQDLIKDLKF